MHANRKLAPLTGLEPVTYGLTIRITFPRFFLINNSVSVAQSILSGEKTFVKHLFAVRCSTGASINKLSPLSTIYREKCFAGLAFLYHHLKCSFNFSH